MDHVKCVLNTEQRRTIRGFCYNNFVGYIKELDIEIEEQSNEVSRFVDALLDKKGIFIYGAGRSGLVAKSFGMRNMHLKRATYIIGETTTPRINKDDCIVIVSGSGESKTSVHYAKIGKRVGSDLFTITSFPDSSLGKIADYKIIIKGRRKEDKEREEFAARSIGVESGGLSLSPLGSKFEFKAYCLLEQIITEVATRLGMKEEDMEEIHSILE